MNILVTNQQVNNIPFLEVVQKNEEIVNKKSIFFIHGFMSAKEHNLHYAYLLAEKGFQVILPDTWLHGEREDGLNENELTLRFWEIVIKTIKEIKILRDVLFEQNKISDEKIGLMGTSMGGIITLGALTQYDWIQSAVSLMGNPCYQQLAKDQIRELERYGRTIPKEMLNELFASLKHYDLSDQPEKIGDRPLLFWHGKKDLVVPYHHAYQFYIDVLKDLYQQVDFILDEHAGHKVSRAGVLEVVRWMNEKMNTEKISFSS